jgi:hypothetical protein
MTKQKIIKVEDAPDLVKDTVTGALLNTNVSALRAYKARMAQANHLNDMQQQILDLKTEIREIKELLISTLTSSEKR